VLSWLVLPENSLIGSIFLVCGGGLWLIAVWKFGSLFLAVFGFGLFSARLGLLFVFFRVLQNDDFMARVFGFPKIY